MLITLLCTASWMFAQVTVTGNVRDERDEGAIGATVLLVGSQKGTITDSKGNFRLSVPETQTAVLQVSYVGYETQKVPLNGKKHVNIVLKEEANALDEVMVVAYGTQKKETLTGAISSVKTDVLLRSPNASIATSLAGQITGLSSVATSGQPGKEDPAIYIRGVGSLTEGASSPLILVDGVERSFFQMDPNEIASVTVLKDASATAVFGVRGANGVVLVTTRRGEAGKARISISSSVGIQQPTRILKMADSYTYAQLFNEMNEHDGNKHAFDAYALERFRLGDDPIMYPNTNWREYIMKNASVQTQHNVNVSGGTDRVRYFISAGFLWQDGLFRQYKELDYNNNFNYTRYNYRGNLDLDITKNTLLKVGLGGTIGITHEPNDNDYPYGIFSLINMAQPFNSPGIIDGKLVTINPGKYEGILMNNNALARFYGQGYDKNTSNTMNMDLALTQKLDFITKGLSVEVKGAYNTTYSFIQKRHGSVENYVPYYKSELENPNLDIHDPAYDKTIVYRVEGQNKRLGYAEQTYRGRNWYFEASMRYNRKFGNHNVGGLLLYNQNKKYYPSQFTDVPTAYIGFVGRVTYDYKSRYLAEFDFGYNGSENFAPSKRFGAFPAGSVGYVLSEESFMKKQKVVDYLKLRASVGLVGNDNMSGNRFLYLPDGWSVDKIGSADHWGAYPYGYNFGYNNTNTLWGAVESRIGNSRVSWETALKQNYGVDVHFLNNRLKVSADLFFENRKDILIKRRTIPVFTHLDNNILPVVNMGKVKNHGYEVEVKWDDRIKDDFHYYLHANVSYSKNKIVFQDEVEPNETYLWRTGQPVGSIFGYVADGFYNDSDFEKKGVLKKGLPIPSAEVGPGDVKYRDLNNDGRINEDDQCKIGHPTRPAYTFGLNYGAEYKGFFFSMNWTGAVERSLLLEEFFRIPFGINNNNALMQFHADNRWTPETAATATVPRFSTKTSAYNSQTSSLWVKNGNYLKLKTVTLGYNFRHLAGLKKIGISELSVKLSGYNLLTFDKFKIMDPECTPGLTDSYPINKIYNLGVNITF